MAARKDHAKLAVFDFAFLEQVVEVAFIVRPALSPFAGDALTDFIAPQGIEYLVLGDAMNPARGVLGHALACQDCKAWIKVAWTISSTRSKFRQLKMRVNTETSRPASWRKKCSTSGATGSVAGCGIAF